MPKDILEYLNENDKLKITDSLAQYLEKFKDNKGKPEDQKFGSVDFQFDVSKGAMQGTAANTFFSFDIDKEGILYDFLLAMYDRDLEESEIEAVNEFLKEVSYDITNAYSVALKESIRACVLPDSEAWVIPLNKIQIMVLMFDNTLATDEEDKYLLKIIPDQENRQNIDTPAVMNKLQELREESPGKSNAELVMAQIEAGDPLFNGIKKVARGHKYLWDISISFFVDYSFSEEFLVQQSTVPR